jgi:Protein of unknown function (DUF3011)
MTSSPSRLEYHLDEFLDSCPHLQLRSSLAMASTLLRFTAAATLAASLPSLLAAQTVVRCDSHGPRKSCPADTRGGVSLRYQYSDQGCWQNNTWGFTADSIWVSNGCKADFNLGAVPPPKPQAEKKSSSDDALAGLIIGALAGVAIGVAASNNNHSTPPPPDPGYDGYPRQVRCESNRMDYVQCNAGRVRYAELSRQYSGSPCIYGETWGYRRDSLWVDRGCRADFWVR